MFSAAVATGQSVNTIILEGYFSLEVKGALRGSNSSFSENTFLLLLETRVDEKVDSEPE